MNKSTLNKLSVARLGGVVGALALVASLLIYLIQREINAAVFVPLVIGLVGLAVWLSIAPDDVRRLITRRQALYSGNSILAVVLLAGVVMLVYALANASNASADLTSYNTYTLRPDVAALVRSMKKQAMITVFYTNSQLDQLSRDQPILRMFQDAGNGQIKINQVDPDQQPLAAQKFNASSQARVFVTEVTADGQPDTTPGKIILVNGNSVGEQELADSLLLLEARGTIKVLFSVGNGEIETDKAKKGDASYIRNGLELHGIATDTIDLSEQDIPAGTSALVILAPQQDFTAVEVDRISRYLGDGGRLMLMAEPLFPIATNAAVAPLQYAFLQADSPMTKYLWENWGMKANPDVVYDPSPTSHVDSPYNLLTIPASNSPILNVDSAGSRQLRALLFLARSMQLSGADQVPGVDRAPLLKTSDQAYGATGLRSVVFDADNYKRTDKDLPGPLLLSASAVNTTNNSRLIFIGDSDWIRNDAVTQAGNAQLWSNMMDWLTNYAERTSVTPTVKPQPMIASTGTLNAVVVITLVLLPGLILMLGTFVWWDRARR